MPSPRHVSRVFAAASQSNRHGRRDLCRRVSRIAPHLEARPNQGTGRHADAHDHDISIYAGGRPISLGKAVVPWRAKRASQSEDRAPDSRVLHRMSCMEVTIMREAVFKGLHSGLGSHRGVRAFVVKPQARQKFRKKMF